MLIDWFTVSAQIINFLVLLWLMKRFLYQPVLNAIDARESRIHQELTDAALKQTEAQAMRDEFQRKNEEFVHQQTTLMNQAISDAAAERSRLFDEARTAADAFAAKRRDQLNHEAERLNHSLRRRAVREVFAVTRKVLFDLASVSLEQRLTEIFLQRLRASGGQTAAQFSTAIAQANEPLRVRSAFELNPEQQAEIGSTIRQVFTAPVDVQFETSEGLMSGIELTSGGLKLAWTVSDYLDSLEEGVTELLEQQSAAQPAPAVKAVV